MKPFRDSRWKQRLLFFFAGAIFTVLCGFIPYAINGQPVWPVVRWLPAVAVVVVLILRLIKGRRIRVISYFLGTVTPIVLLIGILLYTVSDIPHRRKFDAQLWRDQEIVEHDMMWPPRLRMVDRLISSGRLDGLTKDQVLELLGPPHDKGFPAGAQSCDIHYYLGPERGFIRIDSEWLFITFDDDDKVDRYWLYRD